VTFRLQFTIKKIHGQLVEKKGTYELMRKVSELDVAHFENPEYYNTLEKSRRNFSYLMEFFWKSSDATISMAFNFDNKLSKSLIISSDGLCLSMIL